MFFCNKLISKSLQNYYISYSISYPMMQRNFPKGVLLTLITKIFQKSKKNYHIMENTFFSKEFIVR